MPLSMNGVEIDSYPTESAYLSELSRGPSAREPAGFGGLAFREEVASSPPRAPSGLRTNVADRSPLPVGEGRGGDVHPLHLPAADFRFLLERQGPSLALWRAAEVAALREQTYPSPVLDLGAGDGLVTSLVLPRVDAGIDPDDGALARAAQTGAYARLIASPIEDAALPADSFATIISNSVLEHLPNIDAVLATAARLLRPGGRLIFTTPTDAFSAWLTLPSARYAMRRNHQLAHRNLWPARRWALHLRRAGLTTETVRPYLCRPLVTLWDTLELTQRIWIGETRLISSLWRRIPPQAMERLASWASKLDLAARAPGGGRLIVARKPLLV